MRFTNRFCDPHVVTKTYHEHLDEWAMCEELGFDGAFVNEHHFTAINIQPSCNITATAMPRARLAVIADAGHTPMREKRETFQRLVHDFLIGRKEGVERDGVVKQ